MFPSIELRATANSASSCSLPQTPRVFDNPLFTRRAQRYSSQAKQVTRNESKARKSPTRNSRKQELLFISMSQATHKSTQTRTNKRDRSNRTRRHTTAPAAAAGGRGGADCGASK